MANKRGSKGAPRRARVASRPIVTPAREPMTDPFMAQLQQMDDDERLPLIDIQDRGDHLVIVAELPGIPKDRVKVDAMEDRLEISGENVLACELDVENYAYLCNERTQTNFHRVVPLPERVVPGKATARITDGVLVVSVPKLRPKERGKTVPVSVR